jgi:hypothetical protein
MNARLSTAALGGLVVFVALACGEEDDPAQPTDTADASADGRLVDTGVALDASVPVDGAIAEAGTPLVFRDINHVLGTGQSLSVGAQGAPALSTAQPFANVMFATGVIAGAKDLTSFVPLVEGIGDVSPPYPKVETLSSAFANLVSRMAKDEVLVGQPPGKTSHDLLVSAHGIGGIAYVGLKKGTTAFAAGMAQVKAGIAVSQKLGKSYVVRAVTNVHGESDHISGNSKYLENLVEWQSDYDTDVRALTGQAEPVPMFHTQMSSWTAFGQATSVIPGDQLAAHVAHPGKIVLVGPKYHLAYDADGVHLSNEGYRHMGEDYAKAYRRTVVEGRAWEPLRPTAVSRAGAAITIKFVVPAPPLVIDETLVKNPGKNGFEFAQTGAPAPAIASVALTAADTVTITLAAEPTGSAKRIRYAFTGTANALGGPTTGPRGNLRDSDATTSRHGYPLYNWCVHFDAAVP